jgi:hypothetical protein
MPQQVEDLRLYGLRIAADPKFVAVDIKLALAESIFHGARIAWTP